MSDKVIIAVELNKDNKLQIRINTTNEGIIALALMVMNEEANKLVRSVIVEGNKKVESAVVISAEFDNNNEVVAYINSTSKGLVALAMRKAQQAVDVYLEEIEIKKHETIKKLVTSIPQDVLKKIRG